MASIPKQEIDSLFKGLSELSAKDEPAAPEETSKEEEIKFKADSPALKEEKKPARKEKQSSEMVDLFGGLKGKTKKKSITITIDTANYEAVEKIKEKFGIENTSSVYNKILETFFEEHPVK